jgi:hypothetical protein
LVRDGVIDEIFGLGHGFLWERIKNIQTVIVPRIPQGRIEMFEILGRARVRMASTETSIGAETFLIA